MVSFGLPSGSQLIIRLLDRFFHDIKSVYSCHCLDDVVECSYTFEYLLRHVEEVWRRLRDSDFAVKRKKVKLAVYEVSFIGHTVSPNGIRIDHESILSNPRIPFLGMFVGLLASLVRQFFRGTGEAIK
jgi:Reverse transcriptase (RNA-dependent DNA polymerase).